MEAVIQDVNDASFEHDVIDASREQPVVVDFWAAWCPPCRALGPILEDVAARSPNVTLVKLDTDASPRTAMRYGIRGIPAVKAFNDGAVVDEFVGLQTLPFVERFFATLAPAAPVTLPSDEGGLRALVDSNGENLPARLALGRLLIGAGRLDDADTVLRAAAHEPVADGLRARIELLRSERTGLPPALAQPDGAAELALMPDLITAIRSAGGDERSQLRRVAVGVLTEHTASPEVERLRAQLASALF
ncbi:MAG: hypothetical protein JOY80_01145 [Candidatus Dormibacteraeota bacterium]|nr:hypothetical protein [Candidatus Dormibacteraeota bacterium]